MQVQLPDVPKGFFFKWDFPLNPPNPLQVVTHQITGEYPWALRAISAASGAMGGQNPQLLIQIQLPDGRFMENDLEDAVSMVGVGSWRRALSRELLCPVGSKLSVTLLYANNQQAPMSVGLILDGAYRRDLKAHGHNPVADLPRYVSGENQNILAPCWMWGQGPETPDGYEDRLYTYATDLVTYPTAQIARVTVSKQLRAGEEFLCRRLLFAVTPQIQGPAPPTGIFLIRARASSGYALMDDFIDAAALIGSAPWACDWRLNPSERVYFDLQLVDVLGGQGTMYLKIYMEGVRRRKKS